MAIDTDSRGTVSALGGRPFLGAILVARGLVTQAQLDEALEERTRTDERVGDILVRRGWIFEQELARALALQYALEYVDLDSVPVDPRAAALLDPELGMRCRALPVRICEQRLVVAVADPTRDVVADLRSALGDGIELVVAEWSLIQGVWARVLGRRA